MHTSEFPTHPHNNFGGVCLFETIIRLSKLPRADSTRRRVGGVVRSIRWAFSTEEEAPAGRLFFVGNLDGISQECSKTEAENYHHLGGGFKPYLQK